MKKYLFLIFTLLLIIPAFFSLIRPGFFPIQDDMQVFRLQQMDKCFSDGQIPCRWIPDAGYQYGYPLYNYYSPLVYYVGEIFHSIGFQFIDSIKILFGLGFILAGLSMYLLAKEFFGEWPALISAILYTYAPYKAQEVYVRGSLNEFWISVFFPLILWAIYKLIKNGNNRYIFWVSFGFGCLFLTHNLLSFLFIPIIIFWVVYWLIMERKTGNWKKLLLGFLIGIGFSAFFLLPLLFERQFVHIETLTGGYFDYRQHFVSIKQLLLKNNWGYGSSGLGASDDLSLSTGIIHWIVGFIAVILSLINFKKNKKLSLLIICFGIIDLLTLFLIHEKSSFIWSIVTPLKWMQFPWRFLSISVFLLSFMSAYAIYSFKKMKYLLGVLIIGVLFILNISFFKPVKWLNISDTEKLSGALWEKELTSSIFDYLPVYAKLPPSQKAPLLPEVLEGKVEITNYYKGSNYQTGILIVKSASVVRLPLFDFPGMKVLLNEKVVDHVNNNCDKEKFCLGLITFNVSEGEYLLKVMLTDTPVRAIGNILSIVSIAGMVFIFIKKDEKILKK
jgi:uncharacterized membrane protein